MWLLPVFSPVARAALAIFYRFEVAGKPVPAEGPVLLFANHPNSLLDPAAVVAVAGRPVRFLAKAPLFRDPQVGWLVRAAGAIPVYRRADAPGEMVRNQDSFEAVHEALRGGAAAGIFPEGMSHSEPSLAPLKTGAARIALGAASGGPFPLVPVGLSLRDKGRFRSEALAIVGEPVEWGDLAPRGAEDPEAVRELTRRMEASLREVTVNLERWEDAPLVELAQEIYLAEQAVALTPAERLGGLREVAEGLARARASVAGPEAEVARAVRAHARVLDTLGLRPAQIDQPDRARAAGWVLETGLSVLVAAPVVGLAFVIFAIPFILTGLVQRRAGRSPDIEATYKLLAGAVLYTGWILLLTLIVGWRLGMPWAFVAAAALVLLGVAAVVSFDRLRDASGSLRRYVVRRGRKSLLAELAVRQRELAERLALLRRPPG